MIADHDIKGISSLSAEKFSGGLMNQIGQQNNSQGINNDSNKNDKGTNEMKACNPKVSIIIPVYNGSQYLREAIDSALAQTYENIEIIVVNDGSNDGGKTEEIVRSYGGKLCYYSKANGGVATALNLAIEMMSGEYFSWLSHDDIYYPQKIEKQLNFLQKVGDNNAVMYSDYTLIDSEGVALGDIKMDTAMLNLKPLYSVLRSGINGCSLLIPRDAFAKVGVFDEKLRTTQDYDLWLRMQLQGRYTFIHQPEVLVKYRVHNQQDTKINPATLPEATALWIGFYDKLKEEDILACEENRYLFLRGMAEFLEKTPYHSAAAFYRQIMFTEKEQCSSPVSDRLQFSTVGRLVRRVKRFLAK